MSILDHLNKVSTKVLPTPKQIIQEFPLSLKQENFIHKSRMEVKKVLSPSDPRLLLIVGPCSIHDIIAAKEYATKLRDLAESVADSFYIVMRVYFEKPRSTLGWKGLLYDPFLNGSNDISTGLRWTRNLLIDLSEMGVPTGCEFLDPYTSNYFGELISWGCIGARTSSSQTHRQLASGLPMPVAFKNNPDGNLETAVRGAFSSSFPHTFIGLNEDGMAAIAHTQGNKNTHIVLRGAENKTNFDQESVAYALGLLRKANLLEGLLIDCSHDNSGREHLRQITVFQSVLNQVLDGNRNIRGLILESNLFAGNQSLVKNPSTLKYAVSLTDPCLDWESTKELIMTAHGALNKQRNIDQKENKQFLNANA
jgi:3-deoxy-7-phosphoheptulonate synthase